MKSLPQVKATAEQLSILAHDPRGILIIRGAAGSGKTTTALLRLGVVVRFWQTQFARQNEELRVLVLTFNRTLAGYVEKLAQAQINLGQHVQMEVATFGKWAFEQLGRPTIIDSAQRTEKIERLGRGIKLPPKFLRDEVDYALGRFLPAELSQYRTVKREGRGTTPAVPAKLRDQLLAEVIVPFADWKTQHAYVDWEDIAVTLASGTPRQRYHIIVVDETQDFQANKVRAIMAHIASSHSLTFVLDSAQRIYPHFFRWNEVGIQTAGAIRALTRNYRNTKQIAAFALPIISGIDIGPDGTLPDFRSTARDGRLPVVLVGRFSQQMAWVVDYIRDSVDLANESVVFLHPLGWFSEIRAQLDAADLEYEDLTRERDWPTSPTNIALSTMHSAKGLEFDHVVLLGLNEEVTPHGEDEGDADLEDLRRLLAMAIGRARNSVIVGYKREEASALVGYFKDGTFEEISV